MKTINKKILLSVILGILTTMPSYWLPKLIIDINKAHFVNTIIDDIIPLHTPAVVIYVLAYLQWILAVYVLLKQDTLFGKRFAVMFAISSVFDFFVYILFPTRMDRPILEVNNVFDWILSIVYSVDTPINLCPSFHCLASTFTIIALNHSNIDKKYKVINIIFSILVYASTLLTKQHCFVDVLAGILLAYLCYLVSIILVKDTTNL